MKEKLSRSGKKAQIQISNSNWVNLMSFIDKMVGTI
ncbi:MAG: hypothetical protein MPEBLZ_03883, partial [Candidatus Methanoperedens nitroreducens]